MGDVAKWVVAVVVAVDALGGGTMVRSWEGKVARMDRKRVARRSVGGTRAGREGRVGSGPGGGERSGVGGERRRTGRGDEVGDESQRCQRELSLTLPETSTALEMTATGSNALSSLVIAG
jgi:hypothetical protein